MSWLLIQNSLLIAVCTSVLASGAGFVCGLWTAALPGHWRKLVVGLAILAVAMPPFLITNCWLDLLGWTGKWKPWLPVNLYSPAGVVWLLSLWLWPIGFIAALSAWTQLESALLETDPALTGAALIRWLLWPMARPAMAIAALLTFVLALNNFAVPAILQVKVFPVEVWIRYSTRLDPAAAWALSWPLILAPLGFLLVLYRTRRTRVKWPRTGGLASARSFRRQLGRAWFVAAGVVSLFLLLLAVALPVSHLVTASRTWMEFGSAVQAGRQAVANSFLFAAATACAVLGFGLASWRLPIGGGLWLPLMAPGVLLGVAAIQLFNQPGLGWFYGGTGIVILAFGVRYCGPAWNFVSHALRRLGGELTDAARVDGASRWQMLRYVQLPQAAPQVAAAWYVTYLLCLWDAETLLLIVPPGGETIALRVFNLLHYGHTGQVNALCLVLLLLAAAPLSLWWIGQVLRKRALAALALMTVAAGSGCERSGLEKPSLESRLFERVEIIGRRGTGAGELNKPRSVALDRQDNLYVVDVTGRVQKFSRDGEYLMGWQMEETDLGKPKGMCRDAAGNIVAVEPHYARINHFTPAGRLVAHWGARGTNGGQLTFPRAVAVNSAGDIFVSEYGMMDRVQQFTAAGERFIRQFGERGHGPGQFNRPEGLGIDRAGRLYVADSCNHRIQVFSPEGKWLRSYGRAGAGPGEFSYPNDVRVDDRGYQFVCEFGNSRVQIFDTEGTLVEILGGPGAAPGQFNNPWAIALDSQGNLFVADGGNHRVQKFVWRKEGSLVTRATPDQAVSAHP